MSQSYHNSDQTGNRDEFIISNYLDFLGEKAKNGKYTCPNCGKKNLSINKDGVKYSCYSCQEGKAIAFKLRELNGEFKPKPKTPKGKKSPNQNSPKEKSNVIELVPPAIKKDKLVELVEFLDQEYKNLKLNEQTLEPYLGDKPFKDAVCSPEQLYVLIAEKYGKVYGKDKVIDSLLYLAGKNKFNPLRDYLFKLGYSPSSVGNFADYSDKIATRYLGTENPLYDQYVKYWLMAAVGRVLSPGCYVRPALILRGEQNIGKTSFFKVLGGDYFSSSLGDAKGKDELLIAHRYWILEWGELETLWGRKALGEVKSFMTRTEDSFRAPYARAVEFHPRKFILCGSTNEEEFLTDKTGNTRFWVIDCGDHNINLEQLEQDREDILSCIAALVINELEWFPDKVKSGKSWDLPREWHELHLLNTQKHEEEFVYAPELDKVLDTWDGVRQIKACHFWDALDMSIKDQAKWRRHVGNYLKSKGLQSKVTRIGGEVTRVWERINWTPPQPILPTAQEDNEKS